MLSRLMTRREQALLFLLAVSILAGSATLAYHAHRGQERVEETAPSEKPVPIATRPAPIVAPAPRLPENKAETPANPPDPPTAAASPPPPAGSLPPRRIAVAVTGAVRRPGLYRLEAGARVGELVEVAGGAKSDADLTRIALPARLIDGTTLTVPYKTDASRETRTGFALNPPQYLAGSSSR